MKKSYIIIILLLLGVAFTLFSIKAVSSRIDKVESSFEEFYNYEEYYLNIETDQLQKSFYLPDFLKSKTLDEGYLVGGLPEKNSFMYIMKNCSIKKVPIPNEDMFLEMEYCDDELLIYDYIKDSSRRIIYSIYNPFFNPVAYGDNIIFTLREDINQSKYDIYIYNIKQSTTTKRTDDGFFKESLQIYKEIVTWVQLEEGSYSLHYLNLSNKEDKKLTFHNDVGEIPYRIVSDEGIFWEEFLVLRNQQGQFDPYCINQELLYYDFSTGGIINITSQIGCPAFELTTYSNLRSYKEKSVYVDYNNSDYKRLYFFDNNIKTNKLIFENVNLTFFTSPEISDEDILWIEEKYNQLDDRNYVLLDRYLIRYNLKNNQKEKILSSNFTEFKVRGNLLFWIQPIDLRKYKLFKMSLNNLKVNEVYSSDKKLYDLTIKEKGISWKEKIDLESCPFGECDVDGKCFKPGRVGGKNKEKICIERKIFENKTCNETECHSYILMNVSAINRKSAGESCELDVDCLSDLCEKNECKIFDKESFLDKIKSWLSNIFGFSNKNNIKCDDLNEENEKEICSICEQESNNDKKNECFLIVAISTSKSDFCNKISNKNIKDECYSEISGEEGNNECDKINSKIGRDDCYLQLTSQGQIEEDFCEEIVDPIKAGRCYEYISDASDGFVDICYKINNLDMKNKCLAKNTQNDIFCEKISDKFLSFECYNDLVIITGDSSLCEKVNNEHEPELEGKADNLRELCYDYENNSNKGWSPSPYLTVVYV
jgi:hypothetical protein